MTEQLYALKRDLDMVTEDILWLKKSYNMLDYIAKVVRDSELEQLAQAAQMRRMDKRFEELEKRMAALEKGMNILEERMDALETRMNRIETRMNRIETHLDSIEKTLQLIVKHLGIQPA